VAMLAGRCNRVGRDAAKVCEKLSGFASPATPLVAK